MMTPAEFARKLQWAAVRARTEIDIPTEAVVEAAAEKARTAIGTYAYGWPQLAASTQADRAARGYAANEPLLRTGEMRGSIGHMAQLSAEGAEGVIYSTDEIAVFQELGTSRGIPPRSFLMASLLRCDPEIEAAFTAFVVSLFAGL